MNSSLTGADPMSDALKNVVTDILRRTVNDIKSMLNRYVNVNGYSFVSLMPEIIFYIRFAELCDKMKKKKSSAVQGRSFAERGQKLLS